MDFQELLSSLWRAHSPKAGLSILGSWIVLQLLPVAHFMAIGAFLVASDWVTGVTAAWQRGDKITSRRLARTVIKVIMYCLAIIAVMMVEKAFLPSSTYAVTVVAFYISLVELFSNLENISSITGSNIIGIVRKMVAGRLPFLSKYLPRKEEREE